jgi:hypothetical protein
LHKRQVCYFHSTQPNTPNLLKFVHIPALCTGAINIHWLVLWTAQRLPNWDIAARWTRVAARSACSFLDECCGRCGSVFANCIGQCCRVDIEMCIMLFIFLASPTLPLLLMCGALNGSGVNNRLSAATVFMMLSGIVAAILGWACTIGPCDAGNNTACFFKWWILWPVYVFIVQFR